MSSSGIAMVMRICFGIGMRWLENFTTSILNGVVLVRSVIPFAVFVQHPFSSYGLTSAEMRHRALVITGTKHWLFRVMLRHCATRISQLCRRVSCP